MLVNNEVNLMGSFTGYNGTKLVNQQSAMSQTSLLQGRPSFNQCSTGKLHLTAISRETDQNITPRAHTSLPPHVSAILVNGDHSTPRSNINNTVSPYESLHMLRQGAQTTRMSSEGFQ